jgi:hypothetical protein
LGDIDHIDVDGVHFMGNVSAVNMLLVFEAGALMSNELFSSSVLEQGRLV